MAKKSIKKEKAAQTGEQPIAAVTKANPAKSGKAPKTAKPPKSAKAPKSAKSSTAPIQLNVEPALDTPAPKKRAKSTRKNNNAVTIAACEFAAVQHLDVIVLEKPQPAPTPVMPVMSIVVVENAQSATRESTHSDEANALYVLGIRYSTGRDVEQDLIAAHKWFNLAAMMGHEGAKSCRADVSSEMSRLQIAEAQRQARDWIRARDVRQSREIEQASPPEPEAKRVTYVRRRAQAIRSANSFARTCACV